MTRRADFTASSRNSMEAGFGRAWKGVGLWQGGGSLRRGGFEIPAAAAGRPALSEGAAGRVDFRQTRQFSETRGVRHAADIFSGRISGGGRAGVCRLAAAAGDDSAPGGAVAAVRDLRVCGGGCESGQHSHGSAGSAEPAGLVAVAVSAGLRSGSQATSQSSVAVVCHAADAAGVRAAGSHGMARGTSRRSTGTRNAGTGWYRAGDRDELRELAGNPLHAGGSALLCDDRVAGRFRGSRSTRAAG